jgi:hypothetical protein
MIVSLDRSMPKVEGSRRRDHNGVIRLGLIANYSRSLEKSYPRKGATALRRESCPLFAADKLADADYRFGTPR